MLTVTGPAEDRRRLNQLFRSSVTDISGGEWDGEKYAVIDDGTWGHFDQDEVRRLFLQAVWDWAPPAGERDACEDVDETVLDRDGRSEVRGYCAWEPPVIWLERVSNLMPTLNFSCRSTTEHERYEEWAISGGESHRTKLEVLDWQKDAWVPLDPNADVRR
jgi:hypothetical protein